MDATSSLARCSSVSAVFLELPIDAFTTSYRPAERLSRGKQLDILHSIFDNLPCSVRLLHLKFLLDLRAKDNTYDVLWRRIPWATLLHVCENLHSAALLIIAVGVLPAGGCDAEEEDTVVPLPPAHCAAATRQLQSTDWSIGSGASFPLRNSVPLHLLSAYNFVFRHLLGCSLGRQIKMSYR